jgi:hypothetical protein
MFFAAWGIAAIEMLVRAAAALSIPTIYFKI